MGYESVFRRLLRNPFHKPRAEQVPSVLARPCPWVGKYPHVPGPEPVLSIRHVAARWACGEVHGEDMPAVAMDLLEAGYDSPGLRRLAAETDAASSADVKDLVARVHRDFGISFPVPHEAAQLYLTRQLAREVIAGQRDIWQAEVDLIRIWNWNDGIEDVAAVFALSGGSVWDDEQERYVSEVTPELLDAYARLAKLTNKRVGF